jgi:hypothetical protein
MGNDNYDPESVRERIRDVEFFAIGEKLDLEKRS